MEIILCLLLGYLLGCIHPAALLSKRKNVNLKETGTKNLGASNALIVMGRGAGIVVMVVDIFKGFLASKIARLLFPKLAIAGLLAGFGTIVGHVYPFNLGFRGGKGLAAFGGMVCAFEPWLLVFYLTVGVVLMLLVNYSAFLPMFGGITFPLFVWFMTRDPGMTAVALAASALIMVKHWSNIGKTRRGEETRIRDTFRTKIFKK